MISRFTAIVFMSMFFVVGTIFATFGDTALSKEKKRCFLVVYSLLILLNFTEWTAEVLNGNVPLIPLRIAAKFGELAFTPLLPIYVLKIFEGKDTVRIAWVLFVCNMGLQLISLFNGCIFYVDAASVYHRGPLYPVYISIVLLTVLLFVLRAADFARRFQVHNVPLIISIIFIAVYSTLMQTFEPSLHLDWSFVSFDGMLLYTYFTQLLQQNDALTKLLNRATFDDNINRMSEGACLIFVDVDHFKEINDDYGHDMGDACLRAVAAELYDIFSKTGYCYRFGGDEFCVIMHRQTDRLPEYLEALSARTGTPTYGSGLPFPSLSYGFAFCTEGRSGQDTLKAADEMMYEQKALHHSQSAEK